MSRSRVTNKLGFLQVCFYQRSIVSGLDTPVSIHWCYLPNLETCSIESGRKHVVLRPLYDLNMIWIYYLVSLIFRESHHIQTIFKSYSNHILVGGLEPWNFMTFPSYWGMSSSQLTIRPSFFRVWWAKYHQPELNQPYWVTLRWVYSDSLCF